MGIIHTSIPPALALWAKAQFGLDRFIETGTNIGDTALWAADHFAEVATIEADPRLHGIAAERLAGRPGARILLGRSQEALPALLGAGGPALVWLDAHWSGPGTAGEEYECPLLEEIALIDRAADRHIVLIDDARLFFNAPAAPHKPKHWPGIDAVTAALRQRDPDAYVNVWRDVILRIPAPAREAYEAFIREQAHGPAPQPAAVSEAAPQVPAVPEAAPQPTAAAAPTPGLLARLFGRRGG